MKVGNAGAVVFDVDDTVYLERDYVSSGFAAVAEAVADGADIDAQTLRDHLWSRFVSGERGRHFDSLLAAFPEARSTVSVPDLIAVYRGHQPDISFLPGMAELLTDLAGSGVTLGAISDGALASQQAKVEALDLTSFILGPIVLTDVWGREFWKPHPRAFEEVRRRLDVPHDRLIYVADNPAKDFHSPRDLGWLCVRLRLPGQLHEHAPDEITPDVEVRSVADLAAVLERS